MKSLTENQMIGGEMRIRADCVIVAPEGPYLKGQDILVSGGLIRKVTSSNNVEADVTASVVMAGMIDSHGHITKNTQRNDSLAEQAAVDDTTAVLRGVANLAADLDSGVTTMRTLGDRPGVEIAFREAVAAGTIAGPDLIICGRPLRPSHGTAPFLGDSADGPAEIVKAIRQNFHSGAQVVKLFASNVANGSSGEAYLRGDLTTVAAYTKEEIEAAVAEAHRLGMAITAHAIGGDALRWGVEAGIDSIEHGNLMTDADVDLMLEHGTVLSDPNLLLFFDEEFGFPARPNWSDAWWSEKVKHSAEVTESVLSRAVSLGLPIALAVDSNHGLLWREAMYLVERCGASTVDALAAVTTTSAELLNLGDRGTVAEEMRADLLGLNANPIENIRNLNSVDWVMHGGTMRKVRNGRT